MNRYSDFRGADVPQQRPQSAPSSIERLYLRAVNAFNALDPVYQRQIDAECMRNFGISSTKHVFIMLDEYGLKCMLRYMRNIAQSEVDRMADVAQYDNSYPDDYNPLDEENISEMVDRLLYEGIGKPQKNTRRNQKFALSKKDVDRMYKVLKNSPENIRKRHERKLYVMKNKNALKRYSKTYNTMVKKGLTQQKHHRGVKVK